MEAGGFIVQLMPGASEETISKLEGKKQAQIAQELGISINTIEVQIGIAYKKLRQELKDYVPLLLFLFPTI